MGKLHDFLLANSVERQAEKEVKLASYPEPFIIHSITEAENKKLTRASGPVEQC